jgi:hypothetical protein
MLAVATTEKREPDAVNVNANMLDWPYFKLHYSLPQGWLKLDDQVRMDQNRKKHQEAERHAPVHWTYDLLLAAPTPVSADEKLQLPYIHILAIESTPGPLGTYAKMFARAKSLKFLQQQQARNFSGHKFIESDLLHNDTHYEALFDTTIRDYLLIFEFHGRTQVEMDKLARTMESLNFD